MFKKVFLATAILFGSPVGLLNNQTAIAQTQQTNDGWESLGKVTANPFNKNTGKWGPENYIEGELFVKVIADKLIYHFRYLGERYSVKLHDTAKTLGYITFKGSKYKIEIPC